MADPLWCPLHELRYRDVTYKDASGLRITLNVCPKCGPSPEVQPTPLVDPLAPYRDPQTGKLHHSAWPGLYPLYYITENGLTICPKCANEDTSDPPIAADANYENTALYCEDCGERIPSAYED